ncbi:endopeptidase spore protease gpr [hydrocarbon metagenome]|uniref:Endopeptidase spore protease gpr n=1 Tax=hydrocarbon metagenome TaxID=938273 RepID=A0A0W8E3V3_9ZZZZ
MKKTIEEFKLHIDLAVEARDLARGTADVEVEGVEEIVETLEHLKITTINILNNIGASKVGKPVGTYITIETPPLKINDPYVNDEVIQAVEKCMTTLTTGKLKPGDLVLLVGLGNWRATPDALGPKFIEYSPITRQYHEFAPDALVEGMRPVCGIAPGVLGITGLETFEVIKGTVDNIKPTLLVVVDALAAQNVDRIGTTIQMSDTGIQPGAGVGNARHALNEEELGMPVIAIGCPTIVSASIIANQAIKQFCVNSGAMYNDSVSSESVKSILSRFGGSLAVTPKEIDDIIEYTSRTISMGVAQSLFPGVSREQLELFTT